MAGFLISSFVNWDVYGLVLKDPFYGEVDYFENILEVAKAGLVTATDGSGLTLKRLKVGDTFADELSNIDFFY